MVHLKKNRRWGLLFLLGSVLFFCRSCLPGQYSLWFPSTVWWKAMDRIQGRRFQRGSARGASRRASEATHGPLSLEEGMIEGAQGKGPDFLQFLGKVVPPRWPRISWRLRKDLFGAQRGTPGMHPLFTLLDLRGFNTLSENMMPQALVEALEARYFGLMQRGSYFKHEGIPWISLSG